MIFTAVGTQLPFDRLIQYMDEWLAENPTKSFAQIGDSNYIPKHMEWDKFVDIERYNQKIKQSDLIVSHAGMGNIITALENNIPIIVVNRQQKLGEHRNDHQAEGLLWMGKLNGVYTAKTKQELFKLLDKKDTLQIPKNGQEENLSQLINYLNQEIDNI